MPTAPRLTLDSVDELSGVIEDIVDQFEGADYTETLRGFTGTLEETHQGYFEGRRGPGGQGWPRWYFRKFTSDPNHPTLEDSGRLRASLRKGGTDHVERVQPRDLTWGTAVPYAVLHNEGATIRLGISLMGRHGQRLPAGSTLKIPQREHVGINEPVLGILLEAVADATVAALMREGN